MVDGNYFGKDAEKSQGRKIKTRENANQVYLALHLQGVPVDSNRSFADLLFGMHLVLPGGHFPGYHYKSELHRYLQAEVEGGVRQDDHLLLLCAHDALYRGLR